MKKLQGIDIVERERERERESYTLEKKISVLLLKVDKYMRKDRNTRFGTNTS